MIYQQKTPTEDVYKRARTAVLEKLVPLPMEELVQRLTHLTTLLRMPFVSLHQMILQFVSNQWLISYQMYQLTLQSMP